MGVGWSRMNDLTVIQATQVNNYTKWYSSFKSSNPTTIISKGLGKYLQAVCGSIDFAVVIGYDGRYNSQR